MFLEDVDLCCVDEWKVPVPTNPAQLVKHNKKAAKATRINLKSVKRRQPKICSSLISMYQSMNISHKMLLKKKLFATSKGDTNTLVTYLMKMTELRDHLVVIEMKVENTSWCLLYQFLGITKEMMSRGPHIADMEY
jgi:hypothetical protein